VTIAPSDAEPSVVAEAIVELGDIRLAGVRSATMSMSSDDGGKLGFRVLDRLRGEMPSGRPGRYPQAGNLDAIASPMAATVRMVDLRRDPRMACQPIREQTCVK
jgi:hypothetical protein